MRQTFKRCLCQRIPPRRGEESFPHLCPPFYLYFTCVLQLYSLSAVSLKFHFRAKPWLKDGTEPRRRWWWRRWWRREFRPTRPACKDGRSTHGAAFLGQPVQVKGLRVAASGRKPAPSHNQLLSEVLSDQCYAICNIAQLDIEQPAAFMASAAPPPNRGQYPDSVLGRRRG